MYYYYPSHGNLIGVVIEQDSAQEMQISFCKSFPVSRSLSYSDVMVRSVPGFGPGARSF